MINDKWLMFKNYMHNELNITKEDIRLWIENSVEEQAKRLVDNEFNNFDVKKVIKDIISDENYFGSKALKRDVSKELANLIMNKINI